VVEAEQEAAAAVGESLPLPVRIDNPAALEQLAGTVKLNLKPVTDYPGYAESLGGAKPAEAQPPEVGGQTSEDRSQKPDVAAPAAGAASQNSAATPVRGASAPGAAAARPEKMRDLLEEAFGPLRAYARHKRPPPR
jgi:hypothetical protein